MTFLNSKAPRVHNRHFAIFQQTFAGAAIATSYNPPMIRIAQIDAFTDRPFAGNPAAVALLDRSPDPAWMQSLAAEMNLSETAFLEKRDDGSFSLRWFTPAVEVDLCGHATLASAHFLWESGALKRSEVCRFHTRSGLLTATRDGEWIELDFPSVAPAPTDPPQGLFAALGIAGASFVGRNRMDILVEVANAAVVRSMSPVFRALKTVEARGVIVTAKSDRDGFDFLSRFFAPAAGVDEDPVTGSAHTCLTPYWSAKLGKKELTAYQASKRGGVLRLRDRGDRVGITGKAVTVFEGTLS